jgi:hypothetical protein
MESIFGGIVEFHSKEQLRGLTEELTKGLAIKMIEASLEYCNKNGMFSLDEAHIVYKSLVKIKEDDGPNSRDAELQQG